MTGWRARSQLEQGRWDEAAELATPVLQHPRAAAPFRMTPLVVIGRLRSRRGDPDPWTPLDEALELARRAGELELELELAPVAAARAEVRWLAGEPGAVALEIEAALTCARAQADGWVRGELLVWRQRAGIEDVAYVPVPWRRLMRVSYAANFVRPRRDGRRSAIRTRRRSRALCLWIPRRHAMACCVCIGSERGGLLPVSRGPCANAGCATCSSGRAERRGSTPPD
jgi:hypothetical protein